MYDVLGGNSMPTIILLILFLLDNLPFDNEAFIFTLSCIFLFWIAVDTGHVMIFC